jgi:hypothetical protein
MSTKGVICMSKFAIRLNNEPVWFTDGIEELFHTESHAIQAIQTEILVCEEAVRLGYMQDAGSFEDYRILEVTA